jgi:glutathione S-transferase
VLELYHSINSVCAQKIRLALAEKGLQAKEHAMTLRGDQFDPAYMKLNPNAVVPTLIHDGVPVTESTVILYYLDEAFPQPPLMPASPVARAKVRMFGKLLDEYIHNSCIVLTFGTAFRPAFLKLTPQERDAEFAKSPIPRRADYKRDVINRGLDSTFVADALANHIKLLKMMDEALAHGPYLAGADYSNAEAGIIPYILRLELLHLSAVWDDYPRVGDWWQRMRERPSTRTTILDRMTEADWAPFKNLAPDPWPKVKDLLKAA